MIDANRFDSLCQNPPKMAQGIGTYQEKSVHAVLKHCCAEDPADMEVPFLGYVADVKTGNTVWEIQSAHFYLLREKLRCFLDSGCTVFLLYPIPAVRFLLTVDPNSGEMVSRRRAGRRGLPSDLLYELSFLRDLVDRKNLRIFGILMEVEETRISSVRHGRPATRRGERFPVRMLGEIEVAGNRGLLSLLPELPPRFTAAEFAHASRLSPRRAGMTLSFLLARGVLVREKIGRAYQYSQPIGEGEQKGSVARNSAGAGPHDGTPEISGKERARKAAEAPEKSKPEKNENRRQSEKKNRK